jgi:hypothetical protein
VCWWFGDLTAYSERAWVGKGSAFAAAAILIILADFVFGIFFEGILQRMLATGASIFS